MPFCVTRCRSAPRPYNTGARLGTQKRSQWEYRSRIDHGHHAGNAYRALTDTVAFAEAVQAAMDLTDPARTLILVTADHSHSFTMSGYPRRGNPILGKVESALGGPATDAAGRPYTTLGYANGPGYRDTIVDLTGVDTEAPVLAKPINMPIMYEFYHPEHKKWRMLSASTVVLRPTRRKICIFNNGSRIGNIKKHGILFPVQRKSP